MLQDEGYIRGYALVEVEGAHPEFEIELKYFDGQPVIAEISRVSTPGRRVYSSIKDLKPVKNGLGISILSTPKGVMSDTAARDRERRRRSPLPRLLRRTHVPYRKEGDRKCPTGVTRHARRPGDHGEGSQGAAFAYTVPEEIEVEPGRRPAHPDPARRQPARTSAMWGLSRTLTNNMVEGVTKGYETVLELVGVGYRAALKGRDLSLQLGFSHDVDMPPPAGITFAVPRPVEVRIAGIDKQLVGETAARIRRVRPPEPYKGKGVRYAGREGAPQGRQEEVSHGAHSSRIPRQRRAQRKRTRLKKFGTGRARLSVFRSDKHISAQVIDDAQGVTVAAASSLEKDGPDKGSDKAAAEAVGKLVAERAKAAGHHRRRVRPRRLHLPRPGESPGRRRARSRPELLRIREWLVPNEGGGNRDRRPRDREEGDSDIVEKLVHINRVAATVKGGRRFSFAALMVVGDGKGRVGFGHGKAREVPEAIRKATEEAKKTMIRVPLRESRTLHHDG